MRNCSGAMLLGLALLAAASCPGISRAGAAEDTEAQPAGAPPAAGPSENTADLCKDGLDNDGDSKTDCQDEECAAISFCRYPATPAPAAGTSTAAATSTSRVSGGGEGKKGGVGLFVSLITFSRTKLFLDSEAFGTSDAKYKMMVTAGVALFGEGFVHPYVALGAELHVIFPKISEEEVWDPFTGETYWDSCSYCERSYGFEVLLRIKVPIKVHRFVGVYPIVTIGFVDIISRYEDTEADNYAGLGWGAGAGVEFYPNWIITPFLDLRYMGAYGWNTDRDEGFSKDEVLYNSFTINLGLRFL